MKRKRTNHKPNIKANAALEALKEDKTLTEIADKYSVHQNQIQRWRKQLKENAADIFGGNEKENKDKDKLIEQLHAKVGELTMERDFLSKALGR